MPGPHFVSRLPIVHLEITRGQARVKMRRVSQPVFLIGRADDCDLVLGDQQFPDVHMYIFLTNTSVRLRCLTDGPEVTVDGKPVSTIPLRDGDRIRTGPYEFCVHVDSSPTKGRGPRRHAILAAHEATTMDEDIANSARESVLHLLDDIRNEVLLGSEPSSAATPTVILPRHSA